MNTMTLRPFQLGAMLFVPATRNDLVDIANGGKFGHVRSIIFDLEDSVAARDLESACRNLQEALPRFRKIEGRTLLVRVRNPRNFAEIYGFDGIANLTGFVLPKFDDLNFGDYMSVVAYEDDCELYPILETGVVYDAEIYKLRRQLCGEQARRHIHSLMIGCNDLMQLVNVRRKSTNTIYKTIIGTHIDRLVGIFRPHGFNLIGTVFEGYGREFEAVLRHEVELDLEHGLVGKLAINPAQVSLIEDVYMVSSDEYEEAKFILDPESPAVHGRNNVMVEPTTHSGWARNIMLRARVFGIRSAPLFPPDAETAAALTH